MTVRSLSTLSPQVQTLHLQNYLHLSSAVLFFRRNRSLMMKSCRTVLLLDMSFLLVDFIIQAALEDSRQSEKMTYLSAKVINFQIKMTEAATDKGRANSSLKKTKGKAQAVQNIPTESNNAAHAEVL